MHGQAMAIPVSVHAGERGRKRDVNALGVYSCSVREKLGGSCSQNTMWIIGGRESE